MRRWGLIAALSLAAVCGAVWAGEFENLARHPGTMLAIAGVRPEKAALLADGSLETALTLPDAEGREIVFTLPETRMLDHLLVAGPFSQGGGTVQRLRITLDDGDPVVAELPARRKHVQRVDLGREARTVRLRIERLHPGAVDGALSEIEINAALGGETCGFATGPGAWHPDENVRRDWKPGAVEFTGIPSTSRLARWRYPLRVSGGDRIAIAATLSGSPGRFALMLSGDDPEQAFVALAESETAAFAGGGAPTEMKGSIPVPERFRGRKLLAEVQYLVARGQPSAVTLRAFRADVRPAGTGVAVAALPATWKARLDFDRFRRLGERDWILPGVPDHDWETWSVPGGPKFVDGFAYGFLRYRAAVELEGGRAYRLRLGRMRGNDTAFLNGVEIGQTFGVPRSHDLRRPYLVPARLAKAGANLLAVEAVSGFREVPRIHSGPVDLVPFADDEYALEIRSAREDGSTLFYVGEPVALAVEAYAGARPASDGVRLVWAARDYAGRPAGAGTVPLALPPGGGRFPLAFELPRTPGYYEISARLLAGDRVLAEAAASVGMLFDLRADAPAPADSPFGVNAGMELSRTVLPLLEELPLMKRVGIDHVRIDLNWDMVESEPGRYDWSAPDAVVNAAVRHGVAPYVCFAYAPEWNTDAAADRPQYERITARPRDLGAWRAFVAAAAGRYAGKVREWQLGNEPNHRSKWQCDPEGGLAHYAEMLKIAARAIRDADPAATVVAPGLASTDVNYLRALGRHGVLAEVDAVSYHPYRTTTTPENPRKLLVHWDASAGRGAPAFERDELLRALKESARELPLHITEFSWRIAHPRLSTVTRRQQAEYLVRYHALTLSVHERIQWYEFRNANFGVNGWSILNPDKTPAPSLVAYNVMVRFLRGTRRHAEPAGRDGRYWTAFRRDGDGGEVAIAWSTMADSGAALRAVEDMAVHDLMGVERRRIAAGSVVPLALDGSPVYLRGAAELLPVLSLPAGELRIAPGRETTFPVALHNPYPEPISGALSLSATRKCSLRPTEPAEVHTLRPGETRTLGVALSADAAASAGPGEIQARFRYARAGEAVTAGASAPLSVAFPEDDGRIRYQPLWLVAGPFPAPGLLADGPGEEAGFDPVDGDTLAGRVWRRFVPPDDQVDNPLPELVNFEGMGIRGDRQAAYAFVRIRSPDARRVILRLGSDDGVAAYLNGKAVWRNEAARGVTPDEDAVPVELRPGWNRLLLKISNRDGGWGFVCRLTTPDGRPLPDLEYRLEKP